jgi:hypothetical protein
MEALKLDSNDTHFVLHIDKKYISQAYLLHLMERLRVEQLAQEVGGEGEVENLAEEVSASWWEKNKTRLLTKKDKP